MTMLRELAQAVRDTWQALCDGPDTGAEYLVTQQMFDEADSALEDALGGGCLTEPDAVAHTILAALDAERHQQTRATIAALYWRAGEAREEAQDWITLSILAREMERHL